MGQSCVIMKFLVALSALVACAVAEAEPQYLGYAGYAGYGLGYAGYGYAGLKSAPCVNAANIPVPCHGKRSAEAEPQYLGYAGYAGYGYAAPYGVHSSHLGVCTNFVGQQVPC